MQKNNKEVICRNYHKANTSVLNNTEKNENKKIKIKVPANKVLFAGTVPKSSGK